MTNIPSGFLSGNSKVNGGNCGNQMTWLSTMKLLEGNELFDRFYKVEPDMVVLAMSNAIQKRTALLVGEIANSIEHFDCPKIMLSIGAQNKTSELFYFPPELKSKTVKLLSQMDSVNLRGEYTLDLLRHNGIEGSFEANGCPSILLNEIPLIPKWKDEKVVINMPRYKQCPILFCNFIEMSGDERVTLLAQDNIYQGYSNEKKDINHILSIDVWRDHLEGATFSIGTRIHGSIMSLLCGVPTLCICIDSRTTELCRSLNVPYVIYEDNRFASFNELMSFSQRMYNFNRHALDESVRNMQKFVNEEIRCVTS
jgi:hypothetical protein